MPSDVTMMRNHHIHTFLVGEALMRSNDPGIGLTQLIWVNFTKSIKIQKSLALVNALNRVWILATLNFVL